MILIWGSKNYGGMLVVRGLGIIETRFGHLWYIPLIPTASYIITERTSDGGFRGIKIPLNFTSILIAWARTACVITGLIAALITLFTAVDNHGGIGNLILPASFVVLAAVGGFFLVRAKRDVPLAEALKMVDADGSNQRLRLMLCVAYGQMSKEEGERGLAILDAEEKAVEDAANARLAPATAAPGEPPPSA